MFLNLKRDNVWLDSGLNTFSNASNTSVEVSTFDSTEVNIWVASLPNQLTINPALCFSFKLHRGPLNKILQSALNCSNSVSLSLTPSQTLALTIVNLKLSPFYKFSNNLTMNNTNNNTNYIESIRHANPVIRIHVSWLIMINDPNWPHPQRLCQNFYFSIIPFAPEFYIEKCC